MNFNLLLRLDSCGHFTNWAAIKILHSYLRSQARDEVSRRMLYILDTTCYPSKIFPKAFTLYVYDDACQGKYFRNIEMPPLTNVNITLPIPKVRAGISIILLYFPLYYMFIYIYVCVCMCVCVLMHLCFVWSKVNCISCI